MKTPNKIKGAASIATLVVLLILVYFVVSSPDTNQGETNTQTDISSTSSTSDTSGTTSTPSTANDNDNILANLYNKKQSDVQVSGSGTVTRLLEDDDSGDRHQRFILKLDSGQTLLIAHNIDIAPRLYNLSVGDKVEFYGEYYYSEQGGGIHWTHHDPDGIHADGWLKWNGTTYA